MAVQPLDPPAVPTSPAPHAGTLLIRTATTTDLPATARMHARYLPTGLFPQLGQAFLLRWHAAFLDSRHAVALVAVHRHEDGTERCAGFLLGALDRAAFGRELVSLHRFALAVRGLLALARRPAVLRHFVRTRLRAYAARLTAPRGPIAGPEDRTGDLTAIAVESAGRGHGTGARLAQEFLGRCALAGTGWVEVVTPVLPADAPAFYAATGWSPLHDGTTRDGVLVRYFGRSTTAPSAAPTREV